ncbi:MAG: hypothetical protein AB8B86_01340 [Pseudomonadales bacterium]
MHKIPDPVAWRSGWTFCLVITGLTVGLQLVWTLPALLLRYGGTSFLLVYVGAMVLFSAPLLAVEIWLGRRGAANPISAIKLLQVRTGISSFWRLLGPLHIIVSILVLSYLCVLGGWAMSYGLDSYRGEFLGQNADHMVSKLSSFLEQSNQMVGLLSVFLLAVAFVSAAGVKRGLGFAARLIMPVLVLLLFVLVSHNLSVGSIELLINHQNITRDAAMSSEGIWAAVSLAFFTTSVGLGGIMACSAYMPEHQSIGGAVLGIVSLTIVFALLISLAVLPVLLQANVEIAQGAPALFLNLPLAFGLSLNGDYYGALLYLVVALILACSALVLLEPIVSWLERALIIPRYVASFAGSGLVWLVAVVSAMSFNEWSEFHLVADLTPFGVVELVTAYVLVPLLVVLNGWLFAALLGSPLYSKRFPLLTSLLARLHIAYLSPLVVIGLIWFSLQGKVFF